MSIERERLTVDAFWDDYAGKDFELVRGEVRPVSPSGYRASNTAAKIAHYLYAFLLENPVGDFTGADGGYLLAPNTLRAPDVGFFRQEKAVHITDTDKYLPFPPDLAVEVVSPTDAASDVQEKIELYLEAGVALVWVVYPVQQRVLVYRADGSVSRLTAEDTLSGEAVLPGFELALGDVFEG